MPAILSKAKFSSICILLLELRSTLARQLTRELPAATDVCKQQNANLPMILAITAIIGVILGVAIKSIIDCCSKSSQPEPKVVASAQDLDETEDISPRAQIEMTQRKQGTREERASLMSVDTVETADQRNRVEELERMLDLEKAKHELTTEQRDQLEQKVNELENKNGNFKVETKAQKKKIEELTKKNKEMVVKQADLLEKNQTLTVQLNKVSKQLQAEQGKISAGSGEGAIQMPVLNSEAPAFTPGRQDKKEAKIEQFESSPEEIKEQAFVPPPKPLPPVYDRMDSTEETKNLREKTDCFNLNPRSKTIYQPKWGSTAAYKKLLVDGFKDTNNDNFDDVCKSVVAGYHAAATKAGWSGKLSFLCVIMKAEDYVFDEKYQRTGFYYFEYTLNDQYSAVFMKVDHDRKEDIKISGPFIAEMRNQKHHGFAIECLNHSLEDK